MGHINLHHIAKLNFEIGVSALLLLLCVSAQASWLFSRTHSSSCLRIERIWIDALGSRSRSDTTGGSVPSLYMCGNTPLSCMHPFIWVKDSTNEICGYNTHFVIKVNYRDSIDKLLWIKSIGKNREFVWIFICFRQLPHHDSPKRGRVFLVFLLVPLLALLL